MIPWLLIVALNWGLTITVVDRFPSLQACVDAAESVDAMLYELDAEDWQTECCRAGSCVMEAES